MNVTPGAHLPDQVAGVIAAEFRAGQPAARRAATRHMNHAASRIGLGAMGAGMAGSLRRHSYAMHVFDLRSGAAQAFAEEGGLACTSLAELAGSCPVVVSVVVNAAQTGAMLFGKGGCVAVMQPGSVFVMCSTVDPNWSIALEARLAALGIVYIDAPIAGGAVKAASGQRTMMAAATPQAYAAPRHVLGTMAAKVCPLGDHAGAGHLRHGPPTGAGRGARQQIPLASVQHRAPDVHARVDRGFCP